MTSILFEVGRELVNEVQAGMKAHQDVKEGKQVERRQDKWGDPLPPKTVYSVVRGVEETLGIGKSKGKGVGASKDEERDQDQGTVQGPSAASDDSLIGVSPRDMALVRRGRGLKTTRPHLSAGINNMTSISTSLGPLGPLGPRTSL